MCVAPALLFNARYTDVLAIVCGDPQPLCAKLSNSILYISLAVSAFGGSRCGLCDKLMRSSNQYVRG